jgi:D-alanine-D-alanine ligase
MQAFFDVLGIKFTGSGYLGSALAMHKGVSKQIFRQNGIPTPNGVLVKKGGKFDPAAFSYPCVVKPCSGGSSIGVCLPKSPAECEEAMAQAFKYDKEVLVEEFIEGREFSVGILGDKALPPIEIIPRDGFYDYEHKYQPGWTDEVCPADIDADVARRLQQMALDAFRALRIDIYARGEFILDGAGNIFCLEMNTLPGMTPTSLLPQEAAAVGISYGELCESIIDLSLARYGK